MPKIGTYPASSAGQLFVIMLEPSSATLAGRGVPICRRRCDRGHSRRFGASLPRPPSGALITVDGVKAPVPGPGKPRPIRRSKTIPARPAAIVETGSDVEQRVRIIVMMMVRMMSRARRVEKACREQNGRGYGAGHLALHRRHPVGTALYKIDKPQRAESRLRLVRTAMAIASRRAANRRQVGHVPRAGRFMRWSD